MPRTPDFGKLIDLGVAEFVVRAESSELVEEMLKAEAVVKKSTAVITESYQVMATNVLSVQDRMADAAARSAIAQTRARNAIRQALADGASAGAAAGGGGGMFGGRGAQSLLQLSGAIDDVQYGFRAIVNNIPQVLMFLGPGIAGAAGIAAVAINTLINHWDKLAGAFTSTRATLPKLSADFRDLGVQIKAIDEEIEKLTKERRDDKGFLDPVKAKRLRELEDLSAEGKSRVKDEATIAAHGASSTTAAKDLAKEVAAGAAALPEGADTLVKLLTQKVSPADAAKIVAGALRGEQAAVTDLVKNLPAAPITETFKAGMNADRRKKTEASLEKATDRGVKELDDEERLANEKKVFDIDMQERVLGKRREAINESMQNRPTLAIHGDWQSKIDSMTTERFNRIPTQQLDELRAIKKEMEKLNDKKDELRGAKFG